VKEGPWDGGGVGGLEDDSTIIDFPNLGITYNGGWCTATMTR